MFSVVRLRRVIVVVVSAFALVVPVTGASAAPPPDKAITTPTYTPTNSIVFNNPKGKNAQKRAIITQIDKAIDATPPGGTIRMAQYLFDIDSTADKLIAAFKRKVKVQVLIDDGNVTPQSKRVKAALGSNKAKPSYLTTCKHSCMSNAASVMHAKFYLFSAAGSARLVSMISSANPYTGNTFTSWNNNHTIVGNAKIYNSLSTYFDDMILDKNNPNYYRTTISGIYKLYLFPRAPQAGVETVVPLDVLNHVSCTKVAAGYGSQGRTVVRVAMWGWTAARLNIARKLQSLWNKGCKVEVIYNSGRTNPRVTAALLKRSSRYGVMPVYDSWVDKNHNNLAELYMHHKLLAINGRWFGHPDTKVSYTGSQNYSGPATVSNNDIVLRVKDNATYNAYNANLNYIRAHYTKKVTRVPVLSTKASADMDRQTELQSGDN